MSARAHLVRLHSVEGETDLALENARRLLALAVDAGDAFLETFALASAGSALCDRGDLKRALSSCLEAVSVAERAGNEVAEAMAYAWLAQARVCLGEPEACLEAARHARALARKTDQVGALYHATMWGGEAHLLLGDAAAAAREFELLAEINSQWPSTLHRRARGRLALGRVEEAAKLAAECLDSQPTRLIAARAACTLGLARGLTGAHDRGERLLLQSATICQHLGLRPPLAEARAALAELCRHAGDPERARVHAAEAREIYRACGSELHARRVPL